MSTTQMTTLLRLQITLAVAVVLSGVALVGLFSSALIDVHGLSFQLFWMAHIFLHTAALAIAMTLLIHLAKELFSGGTWFYLTLFFLACGILTLSSFLPWTAPHALELDLPLSRWWRHEGRMIEFPFFQASYLPSAVSLVFIGFFEHRVPFLIAPYHVSWALILAGLLATFVYYKTQDEELGLCAAIVLMFCPFVVCIGGQPASALISASFFGLAYGSGILWGEQRASRWWLLIPGLALGIACLVSELSIVFGGVLLICLFSFYLSWKFPIVRALTSVLIIFLLAIGAASPWLFRNFLWVGKPFYPLGVAKTTAMPFATFPFEWLLGFAFCILSLVPLVRRSRNLHRVAPWARSTWLLVIGGGLGAWALCSHDPFDFIPLLLPLILLAAVGSEQVIERKHSTQPAIYVRVALIVQLVLILGSAFWSGSAQRSMLYFFGMISEDAYLAASVPGYSIAQKFGVGVPKTAAPLLIDSVAPIFYLKRTPAAVSPDGEILHEWIHEEGNARGLARRILLQGANYVIVGSNSTLEALTEADRRIWDEFLREHTTKLIEEDGHKVLRVNSTGS